MKRIFTSVFILVMIFSAFSFEWPIKNFSNENLKTTFSQNRKQRFNPSLVFPNAEDVVSSDNGKMIAVIYEHQNDGNWFESTLGNCVIIAHENNLISVYGNLDEGSAALCSIKDDIASGEHLGKTENSAWTENKESLEFQIVDNGDKALLNPLILMPHISSPQRITIEEIVIENKLDRLYELTSTRSVQAGVYTVYKRRNENYPIHGSSVYINGSELEKIGKDTLIQKSGLLAISGQQPYTSKEFYPDSSRELLGHIMIPHGANTIAVAVRDLWGNERNLTFNIQGY